LYDITRPSTLDNIPAWTTIVRQKGGAIPIMLVGAKLDLATEQRKIPREQGVQIAERNKLSGFVEISAKNDNNVNKAFENLADLTLEKMESKM